MIGPSSKSVPSLLMPGLLSLLLCFLATFITGFVNGFNGGPDVTLKVMASAFMYPAPYILLAVIGGAMFHIKRWAPMALTFNLGGVVLALIWIVVMFFIPVSATSTNTITEESMFLNFVVSSIVSIVICSIIIIEGQIAWPAELNKDG